MSVSVGERIQNMVDYMVTGKFDAALSELCIAIDITSQVYSGSSKSSSSTYKNFLKENMWMILMTGMTTITDSIKIPFSHKDIKSDSTGYCTLDEIVYHVMRCGLLHSTGAQNNIIWELNGMTLAVDNGKLILTPSFIWGMALCVIACPVNAAEKIKDTYWISTATFKYLINDLWGKIDSVKAIAKSAFGITV